MRKYNKVSELTEQYLNGKLIKVAIEYQNENTILISVSYEDSHHSWMNYSLKVNNENNSVDFIHHKCQNTIDGISLSREQQFESAVRDYLVTEANRLAS